MHRHHLIELPDYILQGKGIYPADDLRPYTKLLYANGPGFSINETTCRRENLWNVDTSEDGYVAQSSAPMSSETHGGEDVAIYARGPMAHLLQGVQVSSAAI